MEKNLGVLISVILPVYNCEHYINDSIYSILNQSFKKFELIVIDDCSTDNTVNIINQINDKRIKLVKKSKNTGYTNSLNLGIELAEGKYLARMDGDDICVNNRLEIQFNYLQNNEDVAVCGSWIKFIGTEIIHKYPVNYDEVKVRLLFGSALAHPSVMIRKSFLIDNDLNYNTFYEPAEDYELWTKIIQNGKIVNIPEVLLLYRVLSTSVSNSRTIEQEKNSNQIRLNYARWIFSDFEIDESIHFKFLQPNLIENNFEFENVLMWANNLINVNNKHGYLNNDYFLKYINLRKKQIIKYQLSKSKSIYLFFNQLGEIVNLNNFSVKELMKIFFNLLISRKNNFQ